MNFWFKNTNKDIIITKEDKEDFENNNICRFCVKELIDKIRDHCHLTGKFRGHVHSKCNVNVKQSRSNFFSVILHKFSKYDCHLFYKTLLDKKKDRVEFKIIPKKTKNIFQFDMVVLDLLIVFDSYQVV